MRKREWLVVAVVIGALVAVLASLTAPPAPAQPRTFTWKVQSSFPVTDYPHRSLLELAKSIDQSVGRPTQDRAASVGAVVGFFEVLDAVNRGALDGGLTWPGLWAGKNSAAGLFGSPLGGPFGMGQNEFTAWLFSGGGQELYNELLQKELKMDVVAHFTTIQPFWEAFGWLKKPMKNLEDLKKLKFRSSGIGLEMFRRMRGSARSGSPAVTSSRPSSGVSSTAPVGDPQRRVYIPEPRYRHGLPAGGEVLLHAQLSPAAHLP